MSKCSAFLFSATSSVIVTQLEMDFHLLLSYTPANQAITVIYLHLNTQRTYWKRLNIELHKNMNYWIRVDNICKALTWTFFNLFTTNATWLPKYTRGKKTFPQLILGSVINMSKMFRLVIYVWRNDCIRCHVFFKKTQNSNLDKETDQSIY